MENSQTTIIRAEDHKGKSMTATVVTVSIRTVGDILFPLGQGSEALLLSQ